MVKVEACSSSRCSCVVKCKRPKAISQIWSPIFGAGVAAAFGRWSLACVDVEFLLSSSAGKHAISF